MEFTELDKQGLHTPIPLWMERNAQKIGWVKEEYDRVKSGKVATWPRISRQRMAMGLGFQSAGYSHTLMDAYNCRTHA